MDEMKELKSEAYDCLAQIEAWQKKLQVVTEKIAKLASEKAEPKTE